MPCRTSIQLNEALLAQVQSILGTTGVKPTVEAAFDQVVKQAKRAALLAQLTNKDGIELSPAVFSESRPSKPLTQQPTEWIAKRGSL